MKTIAILGPTASGKTSLSISLAHEFNANILSLDSLSIYKEIDIASAKPTMSKREGIRHFGIDEIMPNENFSVSLFFDIFKDALQVSKKEDKNLIIVGGTGFYLKSLMDGLSQKPHISLKNRQEAKSLMQDIAKAYKILERNDEEYAQKISKNDTYRIEKWLEVFLQSGQSMTNYFKSAKKEALLKDIEIFEIDTPRDLLRQRIKIRTQDMIKQGLIDEVVYLEKRYTRAPNSMRSIGIKEGLEFLDGFLNKDQLSEKISINTAKLAKRQRTFNSTQFPLHVKGDLETLHASISKFLK